MRFIFTVILFSLISRAYSQKYFKTTGGELIFSSSDFRSASTNSASKIRFSAFFHYNSYFHYDITNYFGVFSGYSIRNLGLIYTFHDTTFKKRAYTIGIPIALKFGNFKEETYGIIGAELEIPFHYKQKIIEGKEKMKYSAWFDNRVNFILPSAFIGLQLKNGFCFKAKFFLTDFLNKNFKGSDFGSLVSYKDLNSRLFLVSLSYNIKTSKLKQSLKNENNAEYAVLDI